jgi:hypothetical protein
MDYEKYLIDLFGQISRTVFGRPINPSTKIQKKYLILKDISGDKLETSFLS